MGGVSQGNGLMHPPPFPSANPPRATPESILTQIFGYPSFRLRQAEIIQSVLSGNDTLVIMPTGGGKSLCYQIPALMFRGVTIVVSPLISLMVDQVRQMRALGIQAAYLNSTLTPEQYRETIHQLQSNTLKIIYVAPETLLKPNILDIFKKSVPVDCITIDEAHCISSWGHDFRPEYRQLVMVRQQFPRAVCIALTATATPRVRNDIAENLRFAASNLFVSSFDRENLFLQIRQKDKPFEQLKRFLKKYRNMSGIIYCATRKKVDELALKLQENGFSACPYHAGLTDQMRSQHQERFIRDDIQIMVATNAFGMGINKPNVRFVIHYDLPKNIESYYQEIGRAGRDGMKAYCLMLFSYGDIHKVNYFIQNMSDPHERKMAGFHLNAMIGYAETLECRRKPLLQYFGESYSAAGCQMCDNCLTQDLPMSDLTIPAQKFLSCVKRTGELFGASHIADVLRGSASQKVMKFNHQQLSTYNIGKEFSKKEWFFLSRQFIQQGLLVQDEHGSLKLTPKAWQVFKGEKVFGALPQAETAKVARERSKSGSASTRSDHYDRQLFELLRQKRKALADAANMPPYIVFSDRTLIEMSAKFPRTTEAMAQIFGVGQKKLETYAPQFMEIIKTYCKRQKKP